MSACVPQTYFFLLILVTVPRVMYLVHAGRLRAVITEELFSIFVIFISKYGGVLSQFVKFNNPRKIVKR